MTETIDAGGLRVNFELAGNPANPVLILSHALGTDLGLWDTQVELFAQSFYVLRYDVRGHGRTQVTPGPYTIDMLGRDLIALMNALSIRRAHVAGVSLGGFIGQWLGANSPDRLNRLVLANTAAQVGTAAGWNNRIATVRSQGLEAIADVSIERWFTRDFIAREPAVIDSTRRALIATPADGYTACCAAIREMNLRALAPLIEAPTLVVTGDADQATPAADAEWLASNIPRACRVTYAAAHLANVEASDQFNRDVVRFLSED